MSDEKLPWEELSWSIMTESEYGGTSELLAYGHGGYAGAIRVETGRFVPEDQARALYEAAKILLVIG